MESKTFNREQFEKKYQVAESLIKLADQMRRKQSRSLVSSFKKIAFFFFAKNYNTLLAVLYLCKQGFGVDAHILARSLLEAVIDFLYISKKPEERSKLYIEYGHVSVKRLLNVWDRYCEERDVLNSDEELRNKINNDYERVKNNYPKKIKWTEASLETKAREVEMLALYDLSYKQGCTFSHSDPRGMLNHLEQPEDGVLTVRTGPSNDWISQSLCTSCLSFFFLIRKYDEIFKLGFASEVEKVEAQIQKAWPQTIIKKEVK